MLLLLEQPDEGRLLTKSNPSHHTFYTAFLHSLTVICMHTRKGERYGDRCYAYSTLFASIMGKWNIMSQLPIDVDMDLVPPDLCSIG